MVEPSKASTTTKTGGNLIAAAEFFPPALLVFHTSHQPVISQGTIRFGESRGKDDHVLRSLELSGERNLVG